MMWSTNLKFGGDDGWQRGWMMILAKSLAKWMNRLTKG